MTRTKTILLIITTIILLIIIIQNSESIQTDILFITIIMPRVVLLLVTLLIGFVAGIGFSMKFIKNNKSKIS